MLDADNPQDKTIRDSRGRRFALTTLLGRGSFGKVYRVQNDETGEILAAKLPLSEEDLPSDPLPPELQDLHGKLVREEATQLKKLPPNRVPRTYGIVDGGGAIPCLLLEFYQDSLLERFRAGMNFAQLCDALAHACRSLEVVHATGQTHGNLKPGNIFFVSDEQGQTQARFTDPLTSLYLKNIETLALRKAGVTGWLPPESTPDTATLPLPTSVDTFSIAKILFEAVVQPDVFKTSYSGKIGPFVGPIDKTLIKRFRTALGQRLHEGNSNPHVRELLVRRATAFMARALSAELEPSPPYRFYSITEMANRLDELRDLFHPGFAQLGMIISGSPRADGSFQEGEDVSFSLSFRCHGGLDDAELITCMTYIRDLVAEEKVKDAGIEVTPGHDGNRFRFNFRIPDLPASEYLVRVALAIKGSPGKPIHRDITIRVLPSENAGTKAPIERPRADEKPVGFLHRSRDVMPAGAQAIPDTDRPGPAAEPPKPWFVTERASSPGDERIPGATQKELSPPPESGRNDLGRSDRQVDDKPRRPWSFTRKKNDIEKTTPPPAPAPIEKDDIPSGDWPEFKEKPRPGRDLVWTADEGERSRTTEERRKGAGGRALGFDGAGKKDPNDLVPAASSLTDDQPARLVIRSGQPEDSAPTPPTRSNEAPRALFPGASLHDISGKTRDDRGSDDFDRIRAPKGSSDRNTDAPTDQPVGTPAGSKQTPIEDVDTQEVSPLRVSATGRSTRRAEIEAATVGQDALRPKPQTAPEPPPKKETPPRFPTVGAMAQERRTLETEAPQKPRPLAASEKTPGSIPPTDSRSKVRDRAAPRFRPPETRPESKKDIAPNDYYRAARATPGEEDDSFFRKGALEPRQFVVLFGALLLVLISAIALIIFLVFF